LPAAISIVNQQKKVLPSNLTTFNQFKIVNLELRGLQKKRSVLLFLISVTAPASSRKIFNLTSIVNIICGIVEKNVLHSVALEVLIPLPFFFTLTSKLITVDLKVGASRRLTDLGLGIKGVVPGNLEF